MLAAYVNLLLTQPLPVFVEFCVLFCEERVFLDPTHHIMFEHVLDMIPRVLSEKKTSFLCQVQRHHFEILKQGSVAE